MVHLDWEYVDLTALTEIDSGNDIFVRSKTWAEVIEQRKDAQEQLYEDTGALTITTAFHQFHIHVSDVTCGDAQHQPISGLFGLSTDRSYAYEVTGNWAGLVLHAEKLNGNRWRIYIRFRKGIIDEVGGYSPWFAEGVDKWIKVTVEDIAAKPKITYKLYDDADFTEPPSFTETLTTTQNGVSPFRYAACCATVNQIGAYTATYNYYTYQESIPIGGGRSRILMILLRVRAIINQDGLKNVKNIKNIAYFK